MAKKKTIVNATIPLDSGFTHVLFNLAAQGYSHIKVDYSGGETPVLLTRLQLLKEEVL